jgi:pimeloyl-ACP methyl ester carboxylesterase
MEKILMIRKILFRMFQMVFQLTEKLFPFLASKWAVKLFFTPRRFNRPKWESNILKDVRKQKIPFKSDFKLGSHEDYYIRYDWDGSGPTVLLVHGWEGRGSQMGHFIQPLFNAGYQVIAFDAIAHGDSPGKRTNMPEIAQIIKDIDKDVGGFHTIIGHSLGGTAAGYAIHEGIRCERLITICSPTTIEFIFDTFAKQINASQNTIRRIAQFLENFTKKKTIDYSFTNFATQISTSGLIIHDKHDKEIPFSQALALHKNWKDSQLILTEGLGHKRILRDEKIILQMINFVKDFQAESNLEAIANY